jgi:hypothetical protein
MSRLEVPLLHRTLWATGDVLLRAELALLLKDQAGNWVPQTFRVDPGSEMTTFPAARARRFDLPMPQKVAPGVVHVQTGLELRSGYLRVQVIGMDATEYVIPSFFLGDPALPLSSYSPSSVPRNLLGLSGVLDNLRLTFDGTASPTAMHGHLLVEKR